MAFERIAYYKSVAQFAGDRLGDYFELFKLETTLFRTALLRTVVAYIAGVVCALFAAAFLSTAVLVTFWDTPSRITAAWCIFVAWLVLTVVAALVARGGAPDSDSFSSIPEQFKLDIDTIRGEK